MAWKPGNLIKQDDAYVYTDDGPGTNMAEDMEAELATLYQNLIGTGLPTAGQNERRLLFVAIARGILKHLDNNQPDINVSQDTHTHTHTHNLVSGNATDEDNDTHTHTHTVTFDITL